MNNLAAARSALQRLVEAVPDTWRQDRVFRGAVIGAGITLAILLVRPGGTRQDRPLPPPSTFSAGLPALPASSPALRGTSLPAQTSLQPPRPPDEVPKITPGHSLGDVTVAPVPDSDRFGTFKSEKHP